MPNELSTERKDAQLLVCLCVCAYVRNYHGSLIACKQVLLDVLLV